jgi:hypothetical protein
MKKLLLIATLVAFAVFAKGQNGYQNNASSSYGTLYHAFKFDIGIGYAIPQNNIGGTNGGATFTLQPHYRLSDGFALGLRMEAAALGNENNNSGDIKVTGLVSGCLTGEFYLSKGGFRPFIGFGAGAFTQENATGNTNDNNNNSNVQLSSRTTSFGVFPEIGFEAGHFRMSADYDMPGSSNNYVAFKLGFFFGGGRK